MLLLVKKRVGISFNPFDLLTSCYIFVFFLVFHISASRSLFNSSFSFQKNRPILLKQMHASPKSASSDVEDMRKTYKSKRC